MILKRSLSFALALVLAASPAGAAPKKTKDTQPPVITHVRISEAPPGKPIVVRARIDDQSEIFAPAVYVRPKGASEFDTLPMQRVRDAFEATIPSEQATGPLEYFIEAFDEEGNGPAREGGPDAPFQIVMGTGGGGTPDIGVVPPPPPPDLTVVKPIEPPPPTTDDDGGLATKWWFWTLIGVAVTGGIVAAVIATRPAEPRAFVDIEVRGPDPTLGL